MFANTGNTYNSGDTPSPDNTGNTDNTGSNPVYTPETNEGTEVFLRNQLSADSVSVLNNLQSHITALCATGEGEIRPYLI